ncbi:TPA: TatD family hydrolase [Pasteurella multocida]|nr:TatD family hydrolase [Pasteurella multocida]HEA3271840.1 TatD family hydrolase [Pasteurella multocida]
MPFFDTHIHLDYLQQETGETLAQLVEQAQQANVQKMLMVGVSSEHIVTLTQMATAYPDSLYYGVGLHPLYIRQHTYADLEKLQQTLDKRLSNCCAVAEIGLERAVPDLLNDGLWEKQCAFLEAQLALAKQYGLAVSLHSRKAHDQLVPFLRYISSPMCGIIHGFSGSYQQAVRFVDLGYKIGVGGTITYLRANKTRDVIRRLPLDCLVLETDAPDMPVFGFQGQANRPERIVNIFAHLCELRAERPEEIKQVIWQNSCKLFSI